METLHGFQRKIENRMFAIKNSWKADDQSYITNTSSQDYVDKPKAELWRELQQNISDCNTTKKIDGYFFIQQEGRFGKPKVLIKRVLRKLLMMGLGWYLQTIYQNQSTFNSKILNALAMESSLVYSLQKEIVDLQRKLEEYDEEKYEQKLLTDRIEIRLNKIENLPTDDEDFYHCFEEEFRGTRDEIKLRMEAYVPMLKERLQDWSNASFVDVGSGRGEWLDILKWNGAENYVGVDLNERQNKIAESYGHKTICEDCIRYLATLPENSLDLITGFQIIEHLYMSDLMELLQQSFRTLKKGGMVLFETPNPKNILVSSYSFYSDVSHKRPLIPETMKFMASWCGFSQTELLFMNTHPHWNKLCLPKNNSSMEKAVEDISWQFYGPQDYVLFATK